MNQILFLKIVLSSFARFEFNFIWSKLEEINHIVRYLMVCICLYVFFGVVKWRSQTAQLNSLVKQLNQMA